MIVLKLAVTMCLCLSVSVTNGVDGCQTSDGQEGVCEPIRECSVLYSLLDNLNDRSISYLRRSRCGGGESTTNPSVCCPRNQPNFGNSGLSCSTPDFQEGQCKPINECSVLFSMLDHLTDEKRNFLRESRCGNRGTTTNPEVCCPSIKPILKSVVKTCKTPHNQQGECKPIKDCPVLYSLLDNLTNQTRTYLRESSCNPVGDKANPNVCCTSEAPVFDYATTSAQAQLEVSCEAPDGQHGTCIEVNKCPWSSETSSCGSSKVCCFHKKSNDLLPKKSECGISSESKIYGGNKTSFDEFTWMALLQYEAQNGTRWFGCGGTLISKRYVLTARHCLFENLKSVRLGEWNTTSNPDCISTKYGLDCAPEVVDIPVEEQIPFRDKTSFRNDIALSSNFLRPICLPTARKERRMSYEGKRLVVAGWGKTERKVPSTVKLKLLVPVIPLPECISGLQRAFHTDEISLQESQICAGGEKGKDTCTGDSGGPLMYRGSRWYIAGIVSFGPNNPCGQEDRPSVYVRVSSYIQWIKNNLKP